MSKTSRTRLDRLGRILTLLAAVVVTVLLAELAVRLWVYGRADSPSVLLQPSKDPMLVYELRPSTSGSCTAITVRQTNWPWSATINEDGYRGALADENSSAIRLVVLGDSFAFGLGVNDEDTFSNRLQERLGNEFEVLNWGVPGYNFKQEVELLRTRVERYQPRLVVVAFHPNDLWAPLWRNARQARLMFGSQLYSLYYQVAGMAAVHRAPAERFRRVVRALDTLIELRREHGFDVVLVQVSCAQAGDDVAVAQFFAAATASGVATFPAEPVLCRKLARREIPHDGHPNPAGHQLLADLLVAIVDKILVVPGNHQWPARTELQLPLHDAVAQ